MGFWCTINTKACSKNNFSKSKLGCGIFNFVSRPITIKEQLGIKQLRTFCNLFINLISDCDVLANRQSAEISYSSEINNFIQKRKLTESIYREIQAFVDSLQN